MKAIFVRSTFLEKCPVVLFKLYKVVQAFDGLWMQLLSMTVEFKINRSNDFREFVKAVSHT